MFRLSPLTAVMLIAAVIASGSWVARTHAQMVTPTADGAARLILV